MALARAWTQTTYSGVERLTMRPPRLPPATYCIYTTCFPPKSRYPLWADKSYLGPKWGETWKSCKITCLKFMTIKHFDTTYPTKPQYRGQYLAECLLEKYYSCKLLRFRPNKQGERIYGRGREGYGCKTFILFLYISLLLAKTRKKFSFPCNSTCMWNKRSKVALHSVGAFMTIGVLFGFESADRPDMSRICRFIH